MKILPGMNLRTGKNWLNFGSPSLLDMDPEFFKDPSTLQDRAFSTTWLMSIGKINQIFMKIL